MLVSRTGCGPGPQLGVCKRQPINVSLISMFLSLSPSLPLSLKINKVFKKQTKKSNLFSKDGDVLIHSSLIKKYIYSYTSSRKTTNIMSLESV